MLPHGSDAERSDVMNRTVRLLSLLVLGVLSPLAAFGQSGVLRGTVTDAQTGEPLAGATVVFEGTSIGAATSLDGEYRIPQAPAGSRTIVVSYLGYTTQRLPVDVRADVVNERDIALRPDVLQGEEVVVTGQAEGQIAAINQQLAANAITNVVSAARIQELPDANAAESVGRLPGVSILRDAGEGTKVTVRGLSPTYNAITVNGESVPATDFQDRSVDLSMISPDMLAGIEVFKSLTPDKDADAIGGLVNFTFKGAAAGFDSNLRVQTGYNSQSGQLGQYRVSGTVSDRFFSNRLGVFVSGSVERADRGSDVLSAAYRIPREALEGEERAPVAIENLNLRDRIETRNRYGGSLLVDYDLPRGRILFTSFGSLLDRDELSRDKQYQVSSFRTRYDLREREVGVSVLSTALEGEHDVFRSTWTWKLSRSSSFQEIPYYHRLRFQELAAFNDADLEEEVGPPGIIPAAKNDLAVTYLYDGRFASEDARERDYAAQTDLKVPFRAGGLLAGYLQAGGKYRGKLRSRDENLHLRRFDLSGRQGPTHVHDAYPEREIEVDNRGYILIDNFLDPSFEADDFLGGQYEFPVGIDRGMAADFYDRLGDTYLLSIFADLGDYEYTEDIGAGYVMTEINITPRLMILPGVRYEHTWTSYDAKVGVEAALGEEDQGTVRDTTAGFDYGVWLPMINARFRVTDWFDIRVARTRTLSRPQYAYLSPGRRVSVGERLVVRGNPELEAAKATNYDGFLSFHSNRLGLLTLGAFYKEIDDLVFLRQKSVLNPVEEGVPATARGFTIEEPVNNERPGIVRGFEAEWQTHLTYLPGPLSGIVLNVNYARIYSETRYPRVLLVRQTEPPFRFTQIDTFRVGRLPNQADDILNLSLGYDRHGFSGRVSLLYQGNSLSLVGDRPEVDAFTETYVRWDIALQQRFTRNLSIFLNVNNLTDRRDLAYQHTAGFPTAEEFYGWTADIGVRYRY